MASRNPDDDPSNPAPIIIEEVEGDASDKSELEPDDDLTESYSNLETNIERPIWITDSGNCIFTEYTLQH
jgi:hypothetical protein